MIGKLCCAATPQPALDNQSCPINKPIQYHANSKTDYPATTDRTGRESSLFFVELRRHCVAPIRSSASDPLT